MHVVGGRDARTQVLGGHPFYFRYRGASHVLSGVGTRAWDDTWEVGGPGGQGCPPEPPVYFRPRYPSMSTLLPVAAAFLVLGTFTVMVCEVAVPRLVACHTRAALTVTGPVAPAP